jgi:hypothetical protein
MNIKMNKDVAAVVAAVKAWAIDAYADSYGASVYVECYENSDYVEEFGRFAGDPEAAVAYAKMIASVHDDGYAGARALERESGEF